MNYPESSANINTDTTSSKMLPDIAIDLKNLSADIRKVCHDIAEQLDGVYSVPRPSGANEAVKEEDPRHFVGAVSLSLRELKNTLSILRGINSHLGKLI